MVYDLVAGDSVVQFGDNVKVGCVSCRDKSGVTRTGSGDAFDWCYGIEGAFGIFDVVDTDEIGS